jgi:membrane protease YdiL (CAAX protease family)
MDTTNNSFSLTKITWVALFVSLIVYPVMYCSGIMGNIVTPIFKENSRVHWWLFWGVNFLFHWIPVGLIYLALRKNGETFQSIGLDLGFFKKYKWWFLGTLILLVVASIVIPKVIYEGDYPLISNTIFMGPISTPERLFVIVGAFTAAFTEEIIFRGFALTRLTKFFKSPWIPLLISIISFLFIHGTPRNYGMAANYLFAGLAFGLPFIFMKMRRLEILIVIHFIIDASLVFAP